MVRFQKTQGTATLMDADLFFMTENGRAGLRSEARKRVENYGAGI
jgi:hypothetical protein